MKNVDSVFLNDLAQLAEALRATTELDDCRVLITGATGLVGSILTKTFVTLNEQNAANIKVYALVRDLDKARTVFEDLLEQNQLVLIHGDVTEALRFDFDVDYIFHTASVTASKTFVTQPVETIMTSVQGTRNVLEYARKTKLKSMVYLSSMEAYGITDSSLESIHESNLGYIDILSVRSSYSEGKRICECLCSAYAAEYGVPVKIARLAQTFGAGTSVNDGRAFAQFTKACMNGDNIVLHTHGNSVGNYCYTTDAVRALIMILLHGDNSQAYNIVNERTTMLIREVACLVSEILTGGKSKIIFDIPDSALTYGYAPDVTMRLSADKLRALGWKPNVDLPEMFQRLAKSFRAQEYER